MKYQLRVTSYIVCRSECDTIIIVVVVERRMYVMDAIGFSFSFSDPCTRRIAAGHSPCYINSKLQIKSSEETCLARSTLVVAEHLL